MIKGVIPRYEYKFFISEEMAQEIQAEMKGRIVPDPNMRFATSKNGYTISSAYFETINRECYHEKLAGTKIRKKLRIRGYCNKESLGYVFFEIKRKVNNFVVKERGRVKLSELERALFPKDKNYSSNGITEKDIEVIDKFRYYIETVALQPTVLITYERQAFMGIENDRLRITFDRDVRSKAIDSVNVHEISGMSHCISPQKIVFEVKFNYTLDPWVKRVLIKYNLFQEAISKFCYGMEESNLVNDLNKSIYT